MTVTGERPAFVTLTSKFLDFLRTELSGRITQMHRWNRSKPNTKEINEMLRTCSTPFEMFTKLSDYTTRHRFKQDNYIADTASSLAKLKKNDFFFTQSAKLMAESGMTNPAVLADIGGADGSMGAVIATRLFPVKPPRVVSVDPNPRQEGVIRGSAEAMPFENESVDIVVFSMVLHHLRPLNDNTPTVLAALAEARRVLRPGGYVLIRDHDGTDDCPDSTRWAITHLAYACIMTTEATVSEAFMDGECYHCMIDMIGLVEKSGLNIVICTTPCEKDFNRTYHLLARKGK